MKHLIIIPTWKCGLNCPYCAYTVQPDNLSVHYKGSNKIDKVEKELNYLEWLDILNQYPEAYIEFTGGEPLRYFDFKELVKNLHRVWAVTSNTLHYTDDIDLSHCYSWTGSLHLDASEEAKELFFENMRKIQKRTNVAQVTLVATIENFSKTFMWADRVHNMGFNVHVHPYYDDPNFNWSDHPKELAFLKKNKYVPYSDRLLKFGGLSCVNGCKAGETFAFYNPEGKKFRCFTELLFKDTKECIFPCDWVYGRDKVSL